MVVIAIIIKVICFGSVASFCRVCTTFMDTVLIGDSAITLHPGDIAKNVFRMGRPCGAKFLKFHYSRLYNV